MPSLPVIAPVAVAAYQCVSAAGDDSESLHQALLTNQTRLRPIELFPLPFDTVVGEIRSPLPELAPERRAYACRNACLALKALNAGTFRRAVQAAVSRYGPHRVGVVLGTSTSGIYDSESAYREMLRDGHMPDDFHFMQRHAAQATAEFLRDELDLNGPTYAISTACSSSAKALSAGQRLIAAELCDAVLVAGVDSLCRLTLRGFHSLALISPTASRPMDRDRAGISIGEAAGLLLLERIALHNAGCPRLLAVGESSDAHHMSAPHPDGEGAERAMRQALELAGLAPDAVDHVNLHATGTPQNDPAEARAVARVFPHAPACSGVKGLIGHTLGAAGAIEAIVCLLALEHAFIPGTCGLRQLDCECPINLLTEPRIDTPLCHVISNAFGFGGNNASALFQAGGLR